METAIGLYLVRSPRWRRAFIAACLPYLLLSVFVDFLHVHPAWGRAGLHVQVEGAPDVLTVPSSQSSRLPDYSCAVCQWLRMGTRLQPSLAVATALGMLPVAVQPMQTEWPESPVPHPPAFRGPPRSFFA